MSDGADLGGVYTAARDWVEESLTTAQNSGAVRTDLPFDLLTESVFALLQSLDRWSVRHLESFSHDEARAMARMQTDFLKRLLAPVERT